MRMGGRYILSDFLALFNLRCRKLLQQVKQLKRIHRIKKFLGGKIIKIDLRTEDCIMKDEITTKKGKKPIENHKTAAWSNIEGTKEISKVARPSELQTDHAKEYVDENEK